MKTKLILGLGLVATTMLASAANAASDNWPNWYIGLQGGIDFHNSDISGSVNSDLDNGFNGTVSLGYRPYVSNSFFDNTRFELALNYAAASTEIGGLDVTALSTMVNVYYDFNRSGYFRPYIGGGIGGTSAEFDDKNDYFSGFLQEENPFFDPSDPSTGDRLRNALDEEGNPIPVFDEGDSDNDLAFSYQLMAGISIAPESMPQTEFNLGYRFHSVGDLSYTLERLGSFDADYQSHIVEAGARFRF